MKAITIGRSSKCDIIISNNYVSATHAEIKCISQGRYVYTDVSSNGSVLNGQIIGHTPIEVTYGAPILLAGKVPLPWEQVQMKVNSVSPDYDKTHRNTYPAQHQSANYQAEYSNHGPIQYHDSTDNEDLGCGYMILCFLIPLVGLILYFVWKDKKPVAAKTAGQVALVGIILNIVISIIASL